MTLREFLEQQYLPDHSHLTDATRKSFKYILNRWERETQNRPLAEIGIADMFDLRNSCTELSPVTANTYVKHVRTLMNHAKLLGLIDTVPMIPSLRHKRKLKPTPTTEDVARMYDVAPQAGLSWPTFEPPYRFWRRWIVVSYLTGFRLSDMIRTLTWDAIHADRIELTVQKTQWPHVVPLCDVLRSHLIRTVKDDERVFPVSASPNIVRRELRKLSEAAETTVKVTPHGLRRCSITEWSVASELAGKLIHGSGNTGDAVMQSYRAALRILQKARTNLVVPESFCIDPAQLQLFFDDTIRPRRLQDNGQNGEYVVRVQPPFAFTDATEWAFGKDRFRFRGVTFPLRAEPLRVLKLLASAEGPVTPEAVAKVAFRNGRANNAHHARRRAIQAVARVRRILKELLSLSDDFDPIPNCGFGDDASWALYVPKSIKPPKLIEPNEHPGLMPQSLRMARKRSGWKQRDVAKRIGVDTWIFCLWERGSLPVYEAHADRLAEVLSPYLEDCHNGNGKP